MIRKLLWKNQGVEVDNINYTDMKNKQANYFSSIVMNAIILSILILISSCSKNIKHESLEEMVSHAKSKVNIIATTDFKSIMDHDESFLIVDCRQAEDYIKGHIPGAINIPRGKLEFSDKISDRHIKIFVCGYTDDCSALSAETLLKLKYHDVKMIENGWSGWSKFFPELVETGSGEPENKSEAAPVEESGGCG